MFNEKMAKQVINWMRCRHNWSSAAGYGFDHTNITGMKREKCQECGAVRWTEHGVMRSWHPLEKQAIEYWRMIHPEDFRPTP